MLVTGSTCRESGDQRQHGESDRGRADVYGHRDFHKAGKGAGYRCGQPAGASTDIGRKALPGYVLPCQPFTGGGTGDCDADG